MARNTSCPVTCKKNGITDKKAPGKCTRCAGESRGLSSHKSGGVKGITNKLSGTHLSRRAKRPLARAKFVDAVRKQKQIWADKKAKAAAAAPHPPPPAAAPAPALKRPVGTVKTRTQDHVRVVEKRQGT